MEQPLVSIALAARNAEHTLGRALCSLLAQSYPNWELLLYDDGSSDGTTRLAQGFSDPRIQLHADGRSLGLATRLNQALDRARGGLFARMDADDIACPERLEKQVAYLSAHRDVDLLASGALVIDDADRPLGLFPRSGNDHAGICARPRSGFYFPHPTWMGRTAWFRRYRYRESLPKSQDQDLLLRSYRESRFALLPEVLLGYRQERLALKKVLQSRRVFARVLWCTFTGYGEPLNAVRAVIAQAAKAAVDTFAIASGLQRLILGHRTTPLPAAEAEHWSVCLRAIRERN